MTTGQSLDTVNESLVAEQLDKIQEESEAKQKALSILQRKVNYALRPVEKKQKKVMTTSSSSSKSSKNSDNESEKFSKPQITYENNTIQELDSSSRSSLSDGEVQIPPKFKSAPPISTAHMLVNQEFDFGK